MSYDVMVNFDKNTRTGNSECGNSWTFWPFKLSVVDLIEQERPDIHSIIMEVYLGTNMVDFSELDAEDFRYVHKVIIEKRADHANDPPFWDAIIAHMENDPRFKG